MNKNYLMLNFCTEYSSEGTTTAEMKKNACFSTVFHSLDLVQKNTYTIKLYKIGDMLNVRAQNNACLLDKAGVQRHLRIVQALFKFNYHLKEEQDFFVLTISLNGPLIYHKYLLSWVRYLYEFPFNVFLQDAYKLKTIKGFKSESIINLFNIVGAASTISIHGTNIHGIGDTSYFKYFLNFKQLKENLKSLENNRVSKVNDIFTIVDDLELKRKFKYIRATRDALHSSDYWDSEELFNTRLKCYTHNYKLLTKARNK